MALILKGPDGFEITRSCTDSATKGYESATTVPGGGTKVAQSLSAGRSRGNKRQLVLSFR